MVRVLLLVNTTLIIDVRLNNLHQSNVKIIVKKLYQWQPVVPTYLGKFL